MTKTVFIVKTDDMYLFPHPDGDIGYTPDQEQAGTFNTEEEAEECAEHYADSGYEIILVKR